MLKKCNELECPTGKRHANPASCGHSQICFALDIFCDFDQDKDAVNVEIHKAELAVLVNKKRN